jgi:hypothetical protein
MSPGFGGFCDGVNSPPMVVEIVAKREIVSGKEIDYGAARTGNSCV